MSAPILSGPEAPRTTATTCPVCTGSRLYYLFSVGTDRVVRCDDCGLLVAPGHDTTAPAPAVTGPAPGDLLARLRSKAGLAPGARVGFDPGVPPDFATHAARLGIAATSADPLAPEFAGHLDAIVLGDRLNRAADPATLLAACHRALSPNGFLVTWTPSLTDWCGGAQPGQLNDATTAAGYFYFDATTLQSVLFRSAFRHLEVLPLHAGAGARPSPDAGCIVVGQPVGQRVRPLLSVIVAIYNEAATAAHSLDQITAKQIPGLDVEVIIVESNSTDGTREIVQRYAGRPHVRVILEERPRGKGRAVREGLQHATGDFVLIQDADLEYDLEDYDLLLEPLLAGRAAFVLGARHGGQTWKIRRFTDQPLQALILNLAHRGFTGLINLSCGLALNDPFTMYKVFRRDCLHGLTFECNRFDFDWEILIKLVRKGYRPIEIPVNYRSRSFKEGKKVRMIRDPLTWLRAWAKARFGPLQ